MYQTAMSKDKEEEYEGTGMNLNRSTVVYVQDP